MRVIAGTAKRLALKTIPGVDTRPTTDRIKETLFNMLQPELCDCRFLDLFAGSGSIGIEALSRGASCAVFVENNPKALACIKDNLKFTGLEALGSVCSSDVLSAIGTMEGELPFHIIFMDPPYLQDIEKQVLAKLQHSSFVNKDTLIVVEAELHTDFSYLESFGYELVKKKKYKTNAHLFLRRAGGERK